MGKPLQMYTWCTTVLVVHLVVHQVYNQVGHLGYTITVVHQVVHQMKENLVYHHHGVPPGCTPGVQPGVGAMVVHHCGDLTVCKREECVRVLTCP